MSGFAGDDTLAEDRYLRAELRRRGCPVGDAGGLCVLRKVARSYGIPTGGMAMDAAPHYASSDADAGLAAAERVGVMGYAGHILPEPPKARTDAMALDAGSDPLSVGNVFPELVARWAANERGGSMFVVPVDKGSVRADERNAGHRSHASAAMAYDEAAAASRAPSIEQMYGRNFAVHLAKIGTAR